MEPENTIYQAMKAANVPMDNHESDLYVPDNETTRAIMRDYDRSFSGFINQQECSGAWLDIPFAFDPWWERRIKTS